MAYQNSFQPSYMGYNPPIPSGQAVGYQMPTYQPPTQEPAKYMQSVAASGSNVMNWVRNEAVVENYLMAPNTTGFFMHIEEPKFYIKSVDAFGVAAPIRKFRYYEENDPTSNADNSVNPDSFKELSKQLEQLKSEYDKISNQYDILSERIEKLTAAEPKRKTVKAVENDA